MSAGDLEIARDQLRQTEKPGDFRVQMLRSAAAAAYAVVGIADALTRIATALEAQKETKTDGR